MARNDNVGSSANPEDILLGRVLSLTTYLRVKLREAQYLFNADLSGEEYQRAKSQALRRLLKELSIDEDVDETPCSFCGDGTPGERISTITLGGLSVTLCRPCYNKAGNVVR